MKPNKLLYYTWRGLIYEAKDQTAEALLNYNKAIEINSEDVDTHALRKKLLEKMGTK